MPPVSVRTLVIAGVLGVPVALAAVGFTSLVHGLESLLWDELPDAANWDEPPWWYVLAIPTLAGVVVAGALRLPGGGGHPPLEGIGLEPPHPLHLPGILLAALATLAGGIVLGPEAPLVAIGLALGAMAARLLRVPEAETKALVIAGAFAAMATIFAGPLPTLLLMFELIVASGCRQFAGRHPAAAARVRRVRHRRARVHRRRGLAGGAPGVASRVGPARL